VVMADEEPWHTGLMRLLLTDTRNAAMARVVALAAAAHPDQRVVVYGGALHMMTAGRYLYDSDTRRPIGQRLPALGVRATDVAAVMLNAGSDPVDGVWNTPGTIALDGPAGGLPIVNFESSKIFGVTTAREVLDFAVHLGPSTRINTP